MQRLLSVNLYKLLLKKSFEPKTLFNYSIFAKIKCQNEKKDDKKENRKKSELEEFDELFKKIFDKDKKGPPINNPPNSNDFWKLVAVVAFFTFILSFPFKFDVSQSITYTEFENILKNHDLKHLVFKNNDTLFVHKKDNHTAVLPIISRDDFAARLKETCQNLEINESEIKILPSQPSVQSNPLLNFFCYFILPLLFLKFILGRAKQNFKVNVFENKFSDFPLFSKKYNIYKSDSSAVKFSDVRGCDEAKFEIKEFVDFLKNPEIFNKLGASIPKGGILYGPPGTGKTLLAKAVAGEAGVPFIFASGSEFIEMYVGLGAKRIRELFTEAKNNSPCIVFIDEIDAIGSKRGMNRGHTEMDQTLNQLLCELDGFKTDSNVVLLCGTNRVEILDSALLRPGRLDRKIALTAPNLAGRVDLFDLYLSKIKIDQNKRNEYSQRLAGLTPGSTGADAANICNEGAIVAARSNAEEVTVQHLELALDRLILGNKLNQTLSPSEKRKVSIHECGHAIVSWFLKNTMPILKVSIVPRGRALGVNQFLPAEDKLTSKEQLVDMMCAILGGRAAEEMIIGSISTGAADDLQKVTQIAYQKVGLFGMDDEIGLVSYPSIQRRMMGDKFGDDCEYGAGVADAIDQRVRKLISECYETAKRVIKEKEDLLLKLSDALSQKEVLSNAEMEQILGKRPEGSLTIEHVMSSVVKS